MANPNPSPSTRFAPAVSGNLHGRPPTRWLRDRLGERGPDGKTARERIADHLVEVATRWTIQQFGRDIEVASGRDAVEAAKILYAYDLGKPSVSHDEFMLTLAEHLRKVEGDRVDMAMKLLGERIHSMPPAALAEFLRKCTADPRGFLRAAQEYLATGEPVPMRAADDPAQLSPTGEEPPK